MDCCGHSHIAASQPWVWGTPLVSIEAMLAGEVGPRGATQAAQTAETFVSPPAHRGSTGEQSFAQIESRSSRQLVEQRFCLFQICCGEAFGEPAVNRRE
jgi:hypothetical protein